jgi:hypothetical protein
VSLFAEVLHERVGARRVTAHGLEAIAVPIMAPGAIAVTPGPRVGRTPLQQLVDAAREAEAIFGTGAVDWRHVHGYEGDDAA